MGYLLCLSDCLPGVAWEGSQAPGSSPQLASCHAQRPRGWASRSYESDTYLSSSSLSHRECGPVCTNHHVVPVRLRGREAGGRAGQGCQPSFRAQTMPGREPQREQSHAGTVLRETRSPQRIFTPRREESRPGWHERGGQWLGDLAKIREAGPQVCQALCRRQDAVSAPAWCSKQEEPYSGANKCDGTFKIGSQPLSLLPDWMRMPLPIHFLLKQVGTQRPSQMGIARRQQPSSFNHLTER